MQLPSIRTLSDSGWGHRVIVVSALPVLLPVTSTTLRSAPLLSYSQTKTKQKWVGPWWTMPTGWVWCRWRLTTSWQSHHPAPSGGGVKNKCILEKSLSLENIASLPVPHIAVQPIRLVRSRWRDFENTSIGTVNIFYNFLVRSLVRNKVPWA